MDRNTVFFVRFKDLLPTEKILATPTAMSTHVHCATINFIEINLN